MYQINKGIIGSAHVDSPCIDPIVNGDFENNFTGWTSSLSGG